MNEEITDVKPPMGFPHITDLAGSEATILQVANSQGDILGYATLNDIDAYIEQKVSETVHSFSQKQIFQDVTINGTFDGNNVINPDKLNDALTKEIGIKFLNLGFQDLNSTVEYKINSNYGLLYIYGWATDGKGYCQLYLVSENPRVGNAVCSLISVGGESPQTTSLVTSNYANRKITVSTTINLNARMYFISL